MKVYSSVSISAILGLSGLLVGLELKSIAPFVSTPSFIAHFSPLLQWQYALIRCSSSMGAAGT